MLLVKRIVRGSGATDHLVGSREKRNFVSGVERFSGIRMLYRICWARLERGTLFLRTPSKTKDMSTVSLISRSADRIPLVNEDHPWHTSNCKQLALNNAAHVLEAIHRPAEIWMPKICILISTSHIMARNIIIFAHLVLVLIVVHIARVHMTREFVYNACFCASQGNLLWPISVLIRDDRLFVCQCHRRLAKTATQFSVRE